ncbi:MAG: quinonprotein alcohol dehydrogenase [Planctomycetaceae bacterium]|nr:quinonprotein alcohol dehydrogenase [Planctomycetaceae bacterium]
MRILLLAFGIVLTAATTRAGETWPNFHGPTNDSHSDSTGLPLTWSETENVVWKTPIHDSGWSTPVVWGNQVWLTTATDDGKKSYGICVDRKNGKIIHDLLLFENADPEDTRKYNSFASPTPVIEEGRVYLHFGSYGTACLDTKTAQVIWQRRDLPCQHYRGPGSSPIVFENLLIVHYDGFDYQYIVALNKLTGQTVWKKDRAVDYGTDNGDIMKAFSTPLVFEAAGRTQLVSSTSKATLVFDPRTGDELWRIRYDGFSTAARPIFGHGLVYINSGFPKGEIFAVRPDGQGDVTETHVVWHERKSLPSKPSSLLIGDAIYSIDDAGVATCLDPKTGESAWAERVGGEFSGSPVYADGRIYAFSHDGKTPVIAPERKYRLLATNQLDGGFRASPAVAGKAFFLRTETHLYRIEQKP